MTPDKVCRRTNLTTDDLVGHLFATMDCGRYPCPICAAIRDGLKERDAALTDLAAMREENADLKDQLLRLRTPHELHYRLDETGRPDSQRIARAKQRKEE